MIATSATAGHPQKHQQEEDCKNNIVKEFLAVVLRLYTGDVKG